MNIIQMSISGAVMILVILLIRGIFKNGLPKRFFYVLWGIVLIRLLIPFSVPCPVSAYSLLSGFDNGGLENITEAGQNNMTVVPAWSGTVVTILTIVWLIGMLLAVLFFSLPYLKYIRLFKESLPVENEFLQEWQMQHKISRHISIRCSDYISSPLTYGIFRPVILLPKNYKDISSDDLKFVLAHEYIHIRQFDGVFKLLLATAVCLHWFNPLVWLMYHMANRDIELSCDEAVVKKLGADEKEAYALSIINMLEVKSGLTPFASHFGKSPVKERIGSIMKYKRATAITIVISVLLILGIVIVLATSGVNNNEPQGNEFYTRWVKRDDGLSYYIISRYEEGADSGDVHVRTYEGDFTNLG